MKLFLAVLFVVVTNNNLFAAKTTVNTLATLTTVYSNARPGDTVVVANGTYNWGEINLVNNFGTSTSAWIVVKAQSISGVIFTGSTYIKFSGTRIRIDGFKFANGNAGTNPVVSFRASTSDLADYSRVSNITIDNYNTLSADTTVENEWIGIFGVHNRVDHCNFINKSNPRATVVVWFSTATFPDKSVSTYHLIDSNYFAGRTYMGGNGGETIRIGVGNNSKTDGYNVIEYNLFEGLTQTEPEIISNKSYHNTYRYNTFKNCNGGLTLRMGRYCDVYGNYFIVNDASKTESYGVRIIDKGHRVFNNYFEGLLGDENSLTSMRAPIIIYNGSYGSADSTNPGVLDGEYFPADNALVAYNTVVNCRNGAAVRLGFTSSGTNPYQPVGIKLANNIFKMTNGQIVDLNAANTSLTYSAEGNLYNSPDGLGISNSTGFTSNSLNFGSRSNGILVPPTSPVQDASVNTSSYSSMLGGIDAQRQTRSAIYDIGCDEVNGTGSVLTGPLDSSKVGVGNSLQYAAQTITFPSLPFKSVGDADFVPGATASSGLAITYTSSNPSVATIVNNKIRVVGSGSTVITASQLGNDSYEAAQSVTQNFIVRINYTYTPSNATILFGTGCKCKSGNLVTNNSTYFTVSSTTTGTRKIDWYGSVVINQSASSVNKITINYDGKNSASKTQLLYLYNWSNSSWTQIDSRTVSTSDVTINKVQTTTPANFVSPTGEIRLRVYSTGGTTNYICSGDWMQFIVESSELPNTSKMASSNAVNNFNNAISQEVVLKSNVLKSENSIDYYLNKASNVAIQLFDDNGNLLRSIKEGKNKPGAHQVTFKTNDLKPGHYQIQLKAGKLTKSIKFNIEK
jgi:poly(beta-D-mannuronate) lyase